MPHQIRQDRFFQNVVGFLMEPEAALWVARGDHRAYDLPDEVREMFQGLFKWARELLKDPSRSNGEATVVQLFLARPDAAKVVESIGGVGEILPELREAIQDCHLIFKHFAEYASLNLEQLFSSEGIVANMRSPHDLLLAMFFPEQVVQGGVVQQLRPWRDIERLRSWVAMRTWFFIMDWVTERQAVAEGGKKMRAFTAFMEQFVFYPPDSDRRIATRFVYDKNFRFERLLGEDEVFSGDDVCVGTMQLSHRVIRVGERSVRAWYASRIKQLAAFYGRLQRRGAVLDHAAASLMFESEEDFNRVSPVLEETLLDGAQLKQKGAQRLVPGNPYSAAGEGGVFLSGVASVAGVNVEIECSHLARFVDGAASLSLFNHKVYEVKRLIMPMGEGRPSLWEIFFPGSLYVPLDSELVAQMVRRALMVVVTYVPDGGDHIHQAIDLVDRLVNGVRTDLEGFLKAKVDFGVYARASA